MTTDTDEPSDANVLRDGYSHESSWELPELAPVFIIISVGLLVLGSGISTAMVLAGQSGITSLLGWTLVTSALRWIDPSTSTMLLISAALIWWQYGSWQSTERGGISNDIVDVHIARLRTIAKWNLAAFVVTIVSVVLLILASIMQNTYSGSVLSTWDDAVQTICMALGTMLLSLLGVVGLQRILAASRTDIGGDDWE